VAGQARIVVGSSGRRLKTLGVAPPKTFCRSRNRFAKTPPAGGAGAGLVAHRSQKSAVNPLTRLASRSEMRRNFQSPHVEGPAATFDPCLNDL